MKQISIFLLINTILSWNTAIASVDTNGDLFYNKAVSAAIHSGHFGHSDSTHKSLMVNALAMNRDLSIMTHFSVLPQDYQMIVKQFLLNYEVGDRTNFSAQKQTGRVRMSAPFLPVNSLSEMFAEIDSSQIKSQGLKNFESSLESAESISVTVITDMHGKGSFGKAAWKGEFAYEDYLAADVIGSPAFKAALYGILKLNTLKSEFNVNLIHAGKHSLEEELRYLDKKQTGAIYEPQAFYPVKSQALLNTQLVCSPRKILFLSLDDYYYLQNELKAQYYKNKTAGASESSISNLVWTHGENSEQGEEANFKSIYAYSDTYISQLLAGWVDPGATYGKIEDTKTFEIRGEIIINF